MRFYDFGKTIVHEAVESDLEAQKAIHDLDTIGVFLGNLPPEKENVKASVATKLKNLSSSISAFLAKAKIQTAQPAQPAPAQPAPCTTCTCTTCTCTTCTTCTCTTCTCTC